MIAIIHEQARWIDDETGDGGSWRRDGGVYYRPGREGEWQWIGFARSSRQALAMILKHTGHGGRRHRGERLRWRRLGHEVNAIERQDVRIFVAAKCPKLLSRDVPGHEQRLAEYERRAEAKRPLFDPPVVTELVNLDE